MTRLASAVSAFLWTSRVNHTSDRHPWFQQAVSSPDSPYRDYYIWRKPKADGSPPTDRRSHFGGSAWTLNEASGEYYYHLAREQPDLNWENEALRREIHAMMNWWLDRGIGGFRLDVIDYIGKVPDLGIVENGPRLHDYLQEMYRHTFEGRDIMTVGETWGATPAIGNLYADPARKELSQVFQFEHITFDRDPVHDKWKPLPFDLVRLKSILSRWQRELLPKAGTLSSGTITTYREPSPNTVIPVFSGVNPPRCLRRSCI